jgi:hypothetical protein
MTSKSCQPSSHSLPWCGIMTLMIGAVAVVACNRVDSTQNAADTAVVGVPAVPESVTAHSQASHPLPQVCPRRPGSTLITAKGIGPAQVGMSLADLNKLCAVRDSALRRDEGQSSNGRAISVGEGWAPILLFVDEAKQAIRAATSSNPFFRTTGGVGVGGTVGELRQSHGRLCGDLGPTGIDVWAASLPGVVFGTTAYPPKMPRNGAGLKRDARAVPDSAQITTVAVSTTPRPCAR